MIPDKDAGLIEAGRSVTPLPPVLSVRLAVKVGEAYGMSRTTYGRAISMSLTVADGYSVFRAKVKKKMEQFKGIEWSESPIMMKPTKNASQAKYVELADDDLALLAQLTRLWGRAGKRKPGYVQYLTSPLSMCD